MPKPTLTRAKLRDLEARRAKLEEEAATLRPVPRLAPEIIEGRVAEWRRLVRASVTQGRTVLDRVLAGRIVFTLTSDAAGYSFEAPTVDRLFSGVAIPPPSFIPVGTLTGTEGIGPGDTFDLAYGRLLEQAVARMRHRTEVASPPGFVDLSRLESCGLIEWKSRSRVARTRAQVV